MRHIATFVLLISAIAGVLAGCQKPVHFPAEPLDAPADLGVWRAYDADHDTRPDFFLFANAAGRVFRIGYDLDGDSRPEITIDLDAIPIDNCRHLVIILDGLSYDLIRKYYDEGHLRLFHPPSRVVTPYPTLTDVCMEDILGYVPCPGFEAEYFDHKANRIVGGSNAYLEGRNQPYNRLLHYRADLIMDAVAYLYPRQVFGKEVNDAKRLFDRRATREFLAYFVSSAGVSTQKGADGQRACLRLIEQLVHQVIRETRGLTKVTLLADHGHSYTPATRIPLEEHLAKKGWRIRDRLAGPKDAAYVRFGLETYASFATRSPEALAKDLIACEGVQLASFAKGDAVVVLGRDGGRAIVRHDKGKYKYEPVRGDPLKLKGILSRVRGDSRGYYHADALLRATIGHEFPAPLQRLWRAHFALVENPPDVIVSLEDRFYSGSKSFGRSVKVASTHGDLSRSSSVTFIMSTAGALPPIMRSRDIPKHLGELLGTPFPMRK